MKGLGRSRRRASGATFAFALRLKEKPRAEAGRDLKWLCEPLTSPEAAPYSTAHVSGAMTRLSQAPVFVLTAPYASAPRIAMAVGTAAAQRRYRFNRRQGGGRHRDAEQHQPERLYEVHGYVFPIGEARVCGQSPYTVHCDLDQAHGELSVPVPEPADGGFELAETNNGHRRILAELSRLSEFRFPETETVSTETWFRLESYNAASPRIGADKTIRPFDVRPARNPFRLNRDFAPSIVRSHDLIRKVCNFSGSCFGVSEHRDEFIIRRCPASRMGPLPRPVGVCEGSEMWLTRRVLSPIIF